MLISRWCPNRE